jgi:ribosomal protein S18 acetylase RimI-like enzyme
MIRIKSLKNISHQRLFEAFQAAFEDYEMQLDDCGLEIMLRRRGFDPGLSFGAFDKDRLVAFTFNGRGQYDRRPTAYDTGTGTIKEYRGRGLASAIFRHSIPYLKEAGIQCYLLEVLQHNHGAAGLYQKLGFQIRREFYYYVHPVEDLVLPPASHETRYSLQAVEVGEVLDAYDFSDFSASWQNSRDSIFRGITAFRAKAVFLGKELVAYCIFEPVTGDITSLAVAKEHRRNGLATKLLSSVIQDLSSPVLKVINIPMDMAGIIAFLRTLNMAPTGKQFEMVKELQA